MPSPKSGTIILWPDSCRAVKPKQKAPTLAAGAQMNDPSPGSGLCIGPNPGAAENYKTIRSVSFSAQKKQRILRFWHTR